MKHETQGAVRKLQNLKVPPSVRLDQAVWPEDLILRRNLLSEVMDQSLRKVLKVIRDPRLAVALVNAQVRMQGRAQVPLSVRLYGKVHITGKGEVGFGQGVSLTGTADSGSKDALLIPLPEPMESSFSKLGASNLIITITSVRLSLEQIQLVRGYRH